MARKTILRAGSVTEDTIEDKDGDTKVTVEQNPDEDKIRFSTAGTERALLDQSELLLSVPLHVSGTNQEGIRIAKGDDDYRQIVFENDGVDAANIHLSNAENLVIMNETQGKDIQFWVDPSSGGANIQAVTVKEDGDVGIGNITPVAKLEVQEDDTSKTTLQLTTENDNGGAGPVLEFKRNSASPSAGDYTGQLKFQGENDAGQQVTYAKMTAKITDPQDTTEDGILEFALRTNGSNSIAVQFSGDLIKTKNGCGLEVDGSVEIKGGIKKSSIRDVDSTTSATDTDYCLRCIQAGPITINLPSKGNNAGQVLIIKDALGNAGTHNITLDAAGSDTIDGMSTFVMNNNFMAVTLMCDGINGWMMIGRT